MSKTNLRLAAAILACTALACSADVDFENV